MPLEESQIKWMQFLSGNDEAYSWIYKTHIQTLYGYGLRFTSDTEIIKDCIQDVFTKLYKNKKQLITPDNVKVYLLIALKNNLLNALYKEDMFDRYNPETAEFSQETTIEEQFIDNESYSCQQKKIQDILATLAPRQKEIIYYRYIQELSFDEICRIMDMNYQSAQNLIQRSLKKVRSLYKQ